MRHLHLSPDHHPTLRHTDREAIGSELQKVLVVLTDLALSGKHAHWNVVGPNFRAVHLHLDEMIDAWRSAVDAVGERAAALGQAPDGRVAAVGAQTPLTALGAGPLRGEDVLAAFAELLTTAVGLVRERTDRLEDIDTVTADLLHGIIATLEQQLWIVRVQTA